MAFEHTINENERLDWPEELGVSIDGLEAYICL